MLSVRGTVTASHCNSFHVFSSMLAIVSAVECRPAAAQRDAAECGGNTSKAWLQQAGLGSPTDPNRGDCWCASAFSGLNLSECSEYTLLQGASCIVSHRNKRVRQEERQRRGNCYPSQQKGALRID